MLDVPKRKKLNKLYIPLQPFKYCIGQSNSEWSELFPNGAQSNAIENNNLPFHPNTRFITKSQCNLDHVARSALLINEQETIIENLENDIWELDLQYSQNNKRYANAYYARFAVEPEFDENFDKYLGWGTDICNNIMTLRRQQNDHILILDNLLQTVQAQRVGWGYSVEFPNLEFVVVITNHFPIIQRTNAEISDPHRIKYRPSFQDVDETTTTTVAPRNKRDDACSLSSFVHLSHNVSTLNEFVQQLEYSVGIFVFKDKDIRLFDKWTHFNDVYDLVITTIKAWHTSAYYGKMLQKLDKKFAYVKSRILDPKISNFELKMKSLIKGITDLKMYMSSDYYWYEYPKKSIEEITNHVTEINLRL